MHREKWRFCRPIRIGEKCLRRSWRRPLFSLSINSLLERLWKRDRYYYMQRLYEMFRKSEPRREIRRIDGVLLYCTFSIDRNSSSMRLNFRRRSQAIIKRHAAKPEKISKYSSIFPITLQHTTRLYRWRMHQHTFDCTAQPYCLLHLDNTIRAIACTLSSTFIYNLILILTLITLTFLL